MMNIRQKKQELKQELEEVIKKLSQRDTNSRIAKFKEELNLRSKELAQIISDLEKIEFEITDFQKYRISKIEEAVSSYFEIVAWKMYEQNKTNDGEKSICEALEWSSLFRNRRNDNDNRHRCYQWAKQSF